MINNRIILGIVIILAVMALGKCIAAMGSGGWVVRAIYILLLAAVLMASYTLFITCCMPV